MSKTKMPEDDQLRQALARCKEHLDCGDSRAALQVLDEAVLLAPNDAEILCRRGRVKLFLKHFEAARVDFAEALKLNPQCSPAFAGLARMHFECGDAVEAEFNAYRAVGLAPDEEDARAILRSLNPHRQIPSATPTSAQPPCPIVPAGPSASGAPELKAVPAITLDLGLTLELGVQSYIHDAKISNPSGALTHIRIGNFCSIATDLTIIGYDHHSEWITMYPFLDDANRSLWPGTAGIPYPQAARFGSNKSRGDIIIGHDVWIGYGVKLFKGITIGNGAVIGACSLVNKSVEPYTIVAGTPARPIRRRFSEAEIALLEQVRWWHLPTALINRYLPQLCSANIAELAAKLEQDPDYQKQQKQVRAAECLAAASTAYARQDLVATSQALQRGLEFTPDAVALLAFLGQVQHQSGAFNDALTTFQRAAALQPNDTDILTRLVTVAALCKRGDLLAPTLKRILEIEPSNAKALRHSISLNLESGRFDEGAQQCCSLIPSNLNDRQLLLQLGRCLREINDLVSAGWCYEQALELDPTCPTARAALQQLKGDPAGTRVCQLSELRPAEAAI